jgi:hypothetical protein
VRRDHKDEDIGHPHSISAASSLRWQTAKHALRCLIGCNISEGIGAAIGFMLLQEAMPYKLGIAVLKELRWQTQIEQK